MLSPRFFLNSFIPLGIISALLSTIFFINKLFSGAELVLHVALHLCCVFILHVAMMCLLLWLSRILTFVSSKKFLAYLYSFWALGIVSVSMASIFTYHFWLAPVNTIIIRNFVFHLKHYSSIPAAGQVFLLGTTITIFSAICLFFFYRNAKKLLVSSPNLVVGLNYILIIVTPGLAVTALLFFNPTLDMPAPIKNGLRWVNREFIIQDPLLHVGSIALRRGVVKGMVKRKEQELDNILKSTNPYPRKNARNLILCTIDALRADYLNDEELRRKYWPFIDSLVANENTRVFQKAFANSNYSTCGIMAILEGRVTDRLHDKGLSLQQFLKQYGYRNYFILSGSHAGFGYMDIRYGNYVDFYFEGPFSDRYGPEDDELLFEGLQVCQKLEEPFFIWFHMMGVHFLGKTDDAFRTNLPDDFDILKKATDENTMRYVNNYRNGSLRTDDRIRRLFQYFEMNGILDQSLIVITADHGENLGEHDELGHSRTLSIQQLHIPLILVNTDTTYFEEKALITQMEIPQLVCKHLDLPVPHHWDHQFDQGFIPVTSSVPDEEGRIWINDNRERSRLQIIRTSRDTMIALK